MTLIVDTSGLLVLADQDAREHTAAVNVVESSGDLVLSPFVLAEADYLLRTRLGGHVALGLQRDVAAGAFHLAPFNAEDVGAAIAVQERFGDLSIGLADASLVVLADRHETADVLTLDLGHFRALRWGKRRQFRILPTDAR